jgi:hypothetical protein
MTSKTATANKMEMFTANAGSVSWAAPLMSAYKPPPSAA